MPVWPFLMLLTAGLTLWGWRHGAWEIPLTAFVGYVAIRAIVILAPAGYGEVLGCASWLIFAGIMIRLGGEVPGFFYVLSALTYPVLLLCGFRLDYMGLSPVIAEIFASCALISIGGGIYGLANSGNDRLRNMVRGEAYPVGLALRKADLAGDYQETS